MDGREKPLTFLVNEENVRHPDHVKHRPVDIMGAILADVIGVVELH